MVSVKKSALLPYPAASVFGLVENIEDYPNFLPWCSGVHVVTRSGQETIASLQVQYLGIRTSFTTANKNEPSQWIEMRLVEGPFKVLQGRWTFVVLEEKACKVELDLRYEFASALLSKLIGPAFQQIANSLVSAFVARAEAVL